MKNTALMNIWGHDNAGKTLKYILFQERKNIYGIGIVGPLTRPVAIFNDYLRTERLWELKCFMKI